MLKLVRLTETLQLRPDLYSPQRTPYSEVEMLVRNLLIADSALIWLGFRTSLSLTKMVRVYHTLNFTHISDQLLLTSCRLQAAQITTTNATERDVTKMERIGEGWHQNTQIHI